MLGQWRVAPHARYPMAVEGHAEVEERDHPNGAGVGPVAAGIADLLTHFFISARGLRLLAPIDDIAAIRARLTAPQIVANSEPPVWAAWTTDAGRLCACGSYDHAQSQRLCAHVLLIEWWLPPDAHYVSWWRCDPQRLQDWTRGRGG
jgi:hypothetical protein